MTHIVVVLLLILLRLLRRRGRFVGASICGVYGTMFVIGQRCGKPGLRTSTLSPLLKQVKPPKPPIDWKPTRSLKVRLMHVPISESFHLLCQLSSTIRVLLSGAFQLQICPICRQDGAAMAGAAARRANPNTRKELDVHRTNRPQEMPLSYREL